MLSDLSGLQESDESVQHVDLSFDVETRCEDSGEIVRKQYTFSYAEEWDKWVFTEYHEQRTPDTRRVSDRDWRRARHVMWSDINESRSISVPPEVADALSEATGADSITIQEPRSN